jgi:hypothetical protein
MKFFSQGLVYKKYFLKKSKNGSLSKYITWTNLKLKLFGSSSTKATTRANIEQCDFFVLSSLT